MLRYYLNQFSDRWPDEYANLYNKIKDQQRFEITILWKYLKLARPDREIAMEVWNLLKSLENDGTGCTNETNPANPQKGRVHYKVAVEDISDGRL